MVQNSSLAAPGAETSGPGPRFLGDQPCLDPHRIRFGHEVYVAALKDVAAACPTPFVIGLYGKWGTGKTTILERLKSILHSQSHQGRRFEVCLFDAWKYSEEESLRRQFLAVLNEELNLRWDLDTLLYRPKEELDFAAPAFGRTVVITSAVFAGITVLLLAVYFLALHLGGIDLATPLMAAASASIMTILLFLVGVVFDLVKISTARVTQPVIFAPEQFERQFQGMLRQAKISDDRRLIVLVDNLDRCAPDVAVNALRTIKTFLEHEGCIFVVACDEDALVRHLTVNKASQDAREPEADAKEFLRKFFQTTIEVEPLDDDLRDFASELVDQAGLHPEVASVVWAASPRDPRRILQFLNRLTLALYVIKAREASGRLVAGEVSANQPYLAKVLWLTELCDDFVADCISYPDLPSLADWTIKYPDMVHTDDRWSRYLSPSARDDKYKELYRFLEATIPIGAKDPRPFFTLQMPALDMGIDDATAFKDMLRQGRAREIAASISDVTDPSKRSRYAQIMTRTIQQEVEMGRGPEALQVCRVAVQCIELLPKPRGPLADAVCGLLRSVDAKKDVPMFDQRSLVTCIGEACRALGDRATGIALQSLNHESQHTDELLDALQHSRLLDEKRWGAVGDFILTTLSAAPDTAFRYLNAIDEKSEAAASLLQERPNILAQIAGMIARGDGLSDRALEVLGRLRQYADSGAMNQLCTSITDLLIRPPESRVEGYLARAAAALGHLDLNKTSDELIPPLHNALRDAVAQPCSIEETAQLLPHLLRLYVLVSEAQQQEIIRLVQGFAHSWPPEELVLLGDMIWRTDIEPIRMAFTDATAQRASDPQRSSEEIQAVLAAAGRISEDTDLSVLTAALRRLLDRPEIPMKELGASQLVAYADRLLRATLDGLVRVLHQEYTARPAPESKGLLAHLLELVHTQRGKSIRNTVADRLKTEMAASDPSVRRHAAESYRILRPRAKLSQSTRKNVAQDLSEGLYRLRRDLSIEDAVLFDILLEEQDNPETLYGTWKTLADTMESLLHSEYPPAIRRMACNLIQRFHKLPDEARDGILEQLEMIADDDSLGQEIRDDASSAIASLARPTD